MSYQLETIRIRHTNQTHFQPAWALYENTFPEEERRELDLQKEIMKNPYYHFDIVRIDGVLVGFILWWQFEGMRYIEHLATKPEYRGKGYGKNIIEHFSSECEDFIILEVEMPSNTINKRRIVFYERLKFKLNAHFYEQLPMQKNGVSVQLKLMSYPDELSDAKLLAFKENFRNMCFTPYLE